MPRVLAGRNGAGDPIREIIDSMVERFERTPESTACLAAPATESGGGDDPSPDRSRWIRGIFIDAFEGTLRGQPAIRGPQAAPVAFFGAVQEIAIREPLRDRWMAIGRMVDASAGMATMPGRR